MNHVTDDDLYFLGKLPPQALDVEEIVLGAILINSKAFDIISQILIPECFYLEVHVEIFEAMSELNKNQQQIDLVSICEHLRKKEKLERVGGAYFIANLCSKVSSTANLEMHARLLFEKHMLRKLITLSQDYLNKGYAGLDDPFELIDNYQLELSKITAKIRGNEIKHISEPGLKTLSNIIDRKNNPIEILGESTGIDSVDQITCGLIKTDLTIIAARPSHGKSTLALQFGKNVAKTKNVLFFSLEMTSEQLVLKTMSSHINQAVNKIRMGQISDGQINELSGEYYNQLSESGMYIYDKPGISIFELLSVAKQMYSNIGLDLIIVDYLQLLHAEDKNKKYGTREQEIAIISKSLKNLAKSLDIPVIALSQLKRQDAGRKSLPKLSDLRESGAIEQDADNVWLLCRPAFDKMYDVNVNGEDITVTDNLAILDVAKNRLGDTGMLYLDFYGASSKFLAQNSENLIPMSQGNTCLINHRQDLDDNPFN